MIVNSFAHAISTKPVDRYTRPEFTGINFVVVAYGIMVFKSVIKETNNPVMLLIDNGPLAIDAGRHPILEGVHNDFIVCYALVFKSLMALLKLFIK